MIGLCARTRDGGRQTQFCALLYCCVSGAFQLSVAVSCGAVDRGVRTSAV